MWNAYPFGASWSLVPNSVNKPSLSIPCISEIELDGLVSIAKVTLTLLPEYTALCCSVMIMLLWQLTGCIRLSYFPRIPNSLFISFKHLIECPFTSCLGVFSKGILTILKIPVLWPQDGQHAECVHVVCFTSMKILLNYTNFLEFSYCLKWIIFQQIWKSKLSQKDSLC